MAITIKPALRKNPQNKDRKILCTSSTRPGDGTETNR